MDNNLHIELQTDLQIYIADLLWACQTKEEVDAILSVWGKEAIVVKEMMIAAAMDTVMDTNIAEIILEPYRSL